MTKRDEQTTTGRDAGGALGRSGPVRRALTRALVGGRLPRWLVPIVHGRMRANRAWTEDYEALRQAEREAAGAPVVSAAQVDLLETLVLSEVAAEETPRRRLLPLTAAAATACALVAVLFHVALPAPSEPAWRARGEKAPPLGLKLRCLSPDGARVLDDAEAGARQLADRLSCPHGGLLSFSVTNLDVAPRYLFAVGVNEAAELRWYAPFSRSARSVRVEPGAVDQLLETLADTSALPKDERVSLFVLYSEAPLSGHELEARLSQARTRAHLHKAARLPVDADVQARIELLSASSSR